MRGESVGSDGKENSPLRKVFLVSGNSDLLDAIIRIPGLRVVGQAAAGGCLVPLIASLEAELVVVDGRGRDAGGLADIGREVKDACPSLEVVLVSGEGCRGEGLPPGFSRGVRGQEELKKLLSETRIETGRSDGLSRLAMEDLGSLRQPETRWLGGGRQVVAVVGPKGGVGKTFVAANLGVALNQRGLNVALVDLDLHGSDLGVHLDLLDRPTMVDLLPHLGDGRGENWRRFMARYPPGGPDVLLGPSRPEFAELVRAEHVQMIIEVLRREYDAVIVDTAPDANNDAIYECVENADCIILVTTLEMTALRRTRIMLDIFKRLNIPVAERVITVFNQVCAQGAITVDRAERFLNAPAAVVIAEDRRSVETSMMAGRPLALHQPAAAPAQGIRDLAGRVVPAGSKTPPCSVGASGKGKGLLAWLRR